MAPLTGGLWGREGVSRPGVGQPGGESGLVEWASLVVKAGLPGRVRETGGVPGECPGVHGDGPGVHGERCLVLLVLIGVGVLRIAGEWFWCCVCRWLFRLSLRSLTVPARC